MTSGYIVEETNDRADDAYDKARQEEVDRSIIEYPSNQTLHARGKYSTITSERRDVLKAMREELETIASFAGRTLRQPENIEFVTLQIASMKETVSRLQILDARLGVLTKAMKELKPAAWEGKADHE